MNIVPLGKGSGKDQAALIRERADRRSTVDKPKRDNWVKLSPSRPPSTQPTLSTSTQIIPSQLSRLWHVSLVGCQISTSSSSLKGLADLAALGLLDLSFTDIDLVTLQNTLRSLPILRLHLFGCTNLFSPAKSVGAGFVPAGAPGSIGSKIKRPSSSPHRSRSPGPLDEDTFCSISAWEEDVELLGFVGCVLPNIWSLNGLLICAGERRRWTDHFLSSEGRGRWNVLVRKLFVPFKKLGTTIDGFENRLAEGSVAAAFSSPDAKLLENAIRVYSMKAYEKTWNDMSRKILNGMPVFFHMSVDEDGMKMERMAMDLAGRVVGYLKDAGDTDKVQEIILWMMDRDISMIDGKMRGGYAKGVGDARSRDEGVLSERAAHRVNLFVILFASLFSMIPRVVVQTALEDVFRDYGDDFKSEVVEKKFDTGGERHWTHRTLSPVYWRYQDRLAYLGLLSTLLQVDYQSATTSKTLPSSEDLFLLNRITLFPLALTRLIANSYDTLFSTSPNFSWESIHIDFEKITQLDCLVRTCNPSSIHLQDLDDSNDNVKIDSAQSAVPLLLLESIIFLCMNGSFRDASLTSFISSTPHMLDVVGSCLAAMPMGLIDREGWFDKLHRLQAEATEMCRETLPNIKIAARMRYHSLNSDEGLSIAGKVLEFRAKITMLVNSMLSQFQ